MKERLKQVKIINATLSKGGFKEGREGRALSLFFAITCFSCNHFEELQTVFEVKLVINNLPLTYVYPNTIET